MRINNVVHQVFVNFYGVYNLASFDLCSAPTQHSQDVGSMLVHSWADVVDGS